LDTHQRFLDRGAPRLAYSGVRISRQRFWSIARAGVLALGVAAGTLVPERAVAQRDYMPHFVSLRHNTVNVRTGPGTQYPVEWVFKRAGLPVEAIAEFEQWIRVRDYEGAEGWVHRRLLSPDRWAVITGSLRTVRRRPSDDSPPVLFAEPGVQGHLLRCADGWCEIEIGDRRGWVRRDILWGVYPDEEFE
jgi:SH3-like domain-containing protein